MPATPLPQIQPNLTNLPPGTVLAPAPGTGNVGYAVLPAQYVTQVWPFPDMVKQLLLLWNILPFSSRFLLCDCHLTLRGFFRDPWWNDDGTLIAIIVAIKALFSQQEHNSTAFL